MTRFLFLVSLLAACGGDDNNDIDSGLDSQAPDATTKDVATVDAPKNDSSSNDASSNDAGTSDSSTNDADTTDATTDDGGNCGGGCTLVSYYCNKGVYPPCTCLSLSPTDPKPVCDAGVVSCFVDPCSGKKAKCVADTCTVQ